jgi:hypothetical protein
VNPLQHILYTSLYTINVCKGKRLATIVHVAWHTVHITFHVLHNSIKWEAIHSIVLHILYLCHHLHVKTTLFPVIKMESIFLNCKWPSKSNALLILFFLEHPVEILWVTVLEWYIIPLGEVNNSAWLEHVSSEIRQWLFVLPTTLSIFVWQQVTKLVQHGQYTVKYI